MLIDSHCHLDFPDFASELDAVVGRMDARRLGERAEWLLTKKLRRAKGGLIGRLFG